MRKLIKKSAGWIHASLIMAIIAPLLYALGSERQDAIGQTLYLKCLIIVFPVIVTDLAIEKCKGLFSYLFVCALTFLATGMLGWSVAGAVHGSVLFWGYMMLLLGETAFVMISRLVTRLQKKKEEDASYGADPSFRPTPDALREPSFAVLIYFLAVYAFALNLDNPPVCNAALFSAAVYAPVTCIYRYVRETENYLSLNKRTCNLPSRRIYGIGNGMLAIFLLLLMLTLLPALFTVSRRHYRDFRKWSAPIEIDYSEMMETHITESVGEIPLEAMMAEYDEPKPTPQWLIALSDIMEVLIFVFLASLLLKEIFSTFHAFRAAADENGDIVEELEEAEAARKITRPAARRRLSQREQIRKDYRRTIRRHRKDRPAAYESPTEIETYAGIAESAEGKELHRLYEQARYGRGTD